MFEAGRRLGLRPDGGQGQSYRQRHIAAVSWPIHAGGRSTILWVCPKWLAAAARKKLDVASSEAAAYWAGSRPGYFVAAAFLRASAARVPARTP